MNIYDFDKTIYDGDSTAAFIKYCVKKNKKTLINALPTVWAYLLYLLGIFTKTQFKEKMYRFLQYVPNIDCVLEEFWDSHEMNILNYYRKQQKEDDIIISASPEFLLTPICRRLGIKYLIASKVDKFTGKYDGENCWGEEKVSRLRREYNINECENFYSDSFSDAPLANIAEKAFIVRKNSVFGWNDYTQSKSETLKSMLLSQEFLMFIIIGFLCTVFNIGFSAIYRLFIPSTVLAFLPGYVTANIASYLLNSVLTFKEPLRIIKFFKYFISYIPNFIIQTITVYLFTLWFPTAPGILAYAVAAIIGVPITFVIMKLFTFTKNKK